MAGEPRGLAENPGPVIYEGNYSLPAILRGARLLEREESGS